MAGFVKSLRKKLVARWGPSLAYWTIKLLGWTIRCEVLNPEIPSSFLKQGTLAIGAFWHGRLLMMPHLQAIYREYDERGRKMCFLVSPHRDGQIIGKAAERFGLLAILGSTTRGGYMAIQQMLKATKEGYDLIIVPDGPKGPRYRVQNGVIELAKLTERPVVPISFSASRKKIFNTWDHFLLPYPFSKGVFVWGEPVYVDPDGDRAHLEEKRVLLEKRLNELTLRADEYFSPLRRSTETKP